MCLLYMGSQDRYESLLRRVIGGIYLRRDVIELMQYITMPFSTHSFSRALQLLSV